MEYYEKYLSQLEAEGTNRKMLEELLQKATTSLEGDPPQRALTVTGQMVSALQCFAQRQGKIDPDVVHTVNAISEIMIDYLKNMGWRHRAVKTAEGWVYEHPPE